MKHVLILNFRTHLKLAVVATTLFLVSSCSKSAVDKPVVKGCMDKNSFTYNAEATEDDGSCKSMSGCLGWLGTGALGNTWFLESFGKAEYELAYLAGITELQKTFPMVPVHWERVQEPQGVYNAWTHEPNQTIYFGFNLFNYVYSNSGTMAIEGIMGHEMGHRVIQHFGWNDYTSITQQELEADMWSGWHLAEQHWALYHSIDPYYNAVIFSGQLQNYNDQIFHGEQLQRTKAIEWGEAVYVNYIFYQKYPGVSWDELHALFLNHVKQL